MGDQAEVEQSAQDRMESLLAAGFLEGEQEQEEAQETAPEVEQEEVEGEEAKGDSQEETAEAGTLKLTHNGEEIEVPIAEAKNLAQQGYDYTQKTQKLAEERKAVELQTQALKAQEEAIKLQAQTQQAFIKEIAKVTVIDEQIAQFEAVDWNALSDNDPVQAQKLYIQYQQLQNNRTRTITEIQQKKQQLDQQQALQAQSRLEQAKADLLKAFPDWNADRAKELRETAQTYGFSEQEISNVTDPRTVKLLADAAAYRKLQSQKVNVTNKVQAKPAVVKPGTKDQKAAARTVDADLRTKLRKSGDQNVAAKLIEAML
jgi:hypothetical protein